ncbi:DUF3592 domain-containing protein [Streptomyces sp. NPDC002221]|uniref:DUF3592 domain-containing protein n=1 Tax=Streptomyces sp. NPDC002221 TaxID=3364639 RepID=UPI0036818E53
MDMLFGSLAGTLVFGGLFCALSRQLVRTVRTVRNGVEAVGRCVRKYATENADGFTQWHYVYGFRTAEGRSVEFEEPTMMMEVGRALTVRYLPTDPRNTATVASSGVWSPVLGQVFGALLTGALTLAGLALTVIAWRIK